MSEVDESNIYKNIEFEKFIDLIKVGAVGHWVEIAKVLGVDQDTITNWKKSETARKAIAEGIEHAMKKMEEVGAKDWRMWESKLKMLGVNPALKVDHTTGGDKLSNPYSNLTEEELRKLASK